MVMTSVDPCHATRVHWLQYLSCSTVLYCPRVLYSIWDILYDMVWIQYSLQVKYYAQSSFWFFLFFSY